MATLGMFSTKTLPSLHLAVNSISLHKTPCYYQPVFRGSPREHAEKHKYASRKSLSVKSNAKSSYGFPRVSPRSSIVKATRHRKCRAISSKERRSERYLILVSENTTCRLTTGSYCNEINATNTGNKEIKCLRSPSSCRGKKPLIRTKTMQTLFEI